MLLETKKQMLCFSQNAFLHLKDVNRNSFFLSEIFFPQGNLCSSPYKFCQEYSYTSMRAFCDFCVLFQVQKTRMIWTYEHDKDERVNDWLLEPEQL